jgi:methyl-accepting chemotaxis protein
MFKNLKIGKRLIISFILVTVIASASGIVSTLLMVDADEKYSNALVEEGFSQGDLGIAMTLFTDSRRTMRDMIIFRLEENEIYQNVYLDAQQRDAQIKEDFGQYLGQVESALKEGEQQSIYDKIAPQLEQYTAIHERLLELVEQGTPESLDEAKRVIITEYDVVYTEIYNDMAELMGSMKTEGDQTSVTLTETSERSVIIVISIIAVAVVISIILGVVIARAISKPITASVDRMLKLANEGDLDSEVQVFDTKDETGELSRSTKYLIEGIAGVIKDQDNVMSAMAEGDFTKELESQYVGSFIRLKEAIIGIQKSMNDTLGKINQSASQVSTGSSQVSNGAQELAQGATEQATTVQELADTLNATATGIKHNATSTEEVSEKIQNVGSEMFESNEKMQSLIKAMAQINESSNEISKIIKTIEDIAFQTNILALNAAVEAARAGAAGQGFAVVADEVRNLASKSADASKNTAGLIETSIEAVNNGTRIADQTAESLVAAVDGAKEIVQTMGEIATETNAQATAVAQITSGIDQISAVVQNNSATAEESAAASEQLSGQAQMMRDLVANFKIRDYDAAQDQAYAQEEEISEEMQKTLNNEKY